jgi:AraC-like DNA-binding protein
MPRLSPEATYARLGKLGLERVAAPAFALTDGPDLAYAFHTHSRHQVLYAFEGSARLEVADATYVLPPQRAAFIPARIEHATTGSARVGSVYLHESLVPDAPRDVRIVAATPLLRELVVHAQRWSPHRRSHDVTADAFFVSFGLLCAEWIAEPLAVRLPRGRSRETQAALTYLLRDVAQASLTGAARAARTSTRTLRRRLHDELGTSFRDLATQARMLAAMERLALPGQRVTDVAFAVGYDSLSAFAKSFRALSGESPRAYQLRMARAGSTPRGPT